MFPNHQADNPIINPIINHHHVPNHQAVYIFGVDGRFFPATLGASGSWGPSSWRTRHNQPGCAATECRLHGHGKTSTAYNHTHTYMSHREIADGTRNPVDCRRRWCSSRCHMQKLNPESTRRTALFYAGTLSQTSLAKSWVFIPDFRMKENMLSLKDNLLIRLFRVDTKWHHVHFTVIGYNIIDTHAKVRSWSSIFFSPLSEKYELHLRSSCWVAQSL